MQTFSLLGFVSHLHALERDMHALPRMMVEKAAAMVCAEARRVIGEGYDDWAPLAPETVAEKVRKGYFAPAPLLKTGEMRASIEYTLTSDHTAEVGSNDQVAVWQELGTSKIPPRSFLAGAAKKMEPQIHKLAAKATVALLMGRGLHSAELRELLHLMHILKDAAHQVKENLEPLVTGKSDGESRQ